MMIQFNDISISYGDIKAVDHISFEVKRDELFGLIGPDGAGKTSLLRMLVTLLLPDSGSIQLSGMDVVHDYRKIRQIVGYMPGRFSLYQDLTVEENLQFFASVFGTTIQENYYLIEDIYKQIEPFKNRRAGKLSGGMKQKLALSCALIHKPELLVLDEPTTGVDAVSRREFWDMLHRLKEMGITIIVSTPYMDEASRCDRVALMQQGTILSIDEPEKIVEQNGHILWKVKSNAVYRLLKDLEEWKLTDKVYPFGQYLHLTTINENITAPDIETYLLEKGHSSLVIEQGFSGIEDIFIELMSQQAKTNS
jgi:ABC-2 type transport system ATP-binding protein